MATSNPNLVCDSSTLTNFKAWAQAISTFIGTTAGWTQSSDTGQVNWSTISSVPGSSSFVYEIWQPNDGLTNFYLKIEYGNGASTGSSTNCPGIRLSIGTATNGAGTLTGTVIGPYYSGYASLTAPSTTTTYPCYMSGDTGRLSFLMWRGGGNNAAQAFAVERSLNATGTYTGDHVTLLIGGGNVTSGDQQPFTQQTLVFSVGAAPLVTYQVNGSQNLLGMSMRVFQAGKAGNSTFNSAVPVDCVAPMIGYFDNPLTSFGTVPTDNISEGQIFTTTMYGSTRTYIATKSGSLTRCVPGWNQPLCVRYD